MKRIALLCCTAVWVTLLTPAASAAEITVLRVDDDGAQCSQAFKTIGGAVAAAKNGDVVEVCPGKYEERVVVTKKIAIRGPSDAVKALDCFLATDETTFAAQLDPSKYAILAPSDSTADSLLSLRANEVELSGLVVQGQIQETPSTFPNPNIEGATFNVFEAAIETDELHSGYNIHDNLIWNNTFGIEFGSRGIYQTDVGTDGRASAFHDNCLRANRWALANQRLHMNDVAITGNESYRTGVIVYELGIGFAPQRVTLRGNVSQSDGSFVLAENTQSAVIQNNLVNEHTAFMLDPTRRIGGARGLDIRGANYGLQIVDNTISHFGGSSITFGAPSFVDGARTTNEALVSGNTLTYSSAGLGFTTGAKTKGTRVLNNVTSHNSLWGIRLTTNNTGATVQGNTADFNSSIGIYAAGAVSNSFEGNSMHFNTTDAQDDVVPLQNAWVNNSCTISKPSGLCSQP